MSPAYVHDVEIGEETNISIIGPSTDVTIRSLILGDSDGIAQLALQASANLSALNAFQVAKNGIISGSGTISSPLVQNFGVIEVGNSAGEITVDGDFAQVADGHLRLEIANDGLSDVFRVTGSAVIDGSIEVVLAPDFTPTHGMYWDVLCAESISLNSNLAYSPLLTTQLLVDQFDGIDVLRVWAAPEPTGLSMVALVTALGFFRFRIRM
jgi:hypothetical protein